MNEQNTETQTETQQPTEVASVSLRDERGLLKTVNYILNNDGTVNWRAMVNPAHLYPNKDWFNRRNMAVPETAEGLRDDQLLIKLAGIKEIARLRGFTKIDFDLLKLERDYVVAKCTINWIANFESADAESLFRSLSSSDVANATFDNTDGFGQKFLETIAANRAFVRTVRNYLGIHIVGEDEIAKGNGAKAQTGDGSADVTPQGVLAKKFSEIVGGEFADFREWLRTLWKSETYRNEEAKNWNSWSDVPSKEARTLLKHLK
jgi:hypothetical protein